MASSNVQRKLTAILCADVVGYSRLMGENEKATLRILTDYRQVFADYIEKFRGRIVNAPGDSILASSSSSRLQHGSSRHSWNWIPFQSPDERNCASS